MFKPPSNPSTPHPWARLLRRALQQGWTAAIARWGHRAPKQPHSTSLAPPCRGVAPSAEARHEAWLDMEQTVDFYMALGMVGAATEVLIEHLKAADWAGPLPYLKLLEIHAKDDNRNAYALTKTLLEQRFAVQAPAWPGKVRTAARAGASGVAGHSPRAAAPRPSTWSFMETQY